MQHKWVIIINMVIYCTAQSTEQFTYKHHTMRDKSVAQLVSHGMRPHKNKLDCSYQNLSTITDLPKFINIWQPYNLKKMNVSHNSLLYESLNTVLKCAHNLTELDFSHNAVHQLCAVPPHEYLKTLILNNNHIKKLSVKNVLGNLKNLTTCLLHNNFLSDENIVDKDGLYENIETLWFDQNGLQKNTTYDFIQLCPNLQCELVSASTAVQTFYTKIIKKTDNHRFYTDYTDYITLSFFIGYIVGSWHGFREYHEKSPDALYYVCVYGLICGLVTSAGIIPCIQLYDKVREYTCYNLSDPACPYVKINTRYINPQPLLLDNKNTTQHGYLYAPGQEDAPQ